MRLGSRGCLVALSHVLLVFALANGAENASGPPTEHAGLDGLPSERFVARVYYRDLAEIRALSAYDLWEHNDRDERYVLVAVDRPEYEEISALGFRLEVDEVHTAELIRVGTVTPTREAGIPGYPCYRTVVETFAAAEQLVAARPDLATWIDAGDSWNKIDGNGGHDMMVLRLTNDAIAGPKPKLVVTASIHAREYAPAELATRFAEHLVEGYGLAADVTWLLDYHEIHLMLQANPDGRKEAESGDYWRKNTNGSYCGTSSDSRGADLNRNFEFGWNCCGGSSDGECDELYRGVAPASEPETQAIQAYLRAEFADRREADPAAAAPLDTSGIYLDFHSFSELVLWPWGVSGVAPNASQLQTLGRKLAHFNRYTPEQLGELFPADGSTVDFAYGELGVAAYLFELGTSFFQDCETFEQTILPDNLSALIYAAKVARAPYLLPAGPEVVGARASAVVVQPGTEVVLRATLDDTRFNETNGTEEVEDVSAAEYHLDVPPFSTTPSPQPAALVPLDGALDSPVEEVTVSLDTTSLEAGRHLAFLRGRDASGNWGPIGATLFWVADGSEGTVSGDVVDSETGFPIEAVVSVELLGAQTPTAPGSGAYSLLLPAGSWSLRAAAEGYVDQVIVDITIPDGGSVQRGFALVAQPRIVLVDDDDDAPDVRGAYTAALDSLGRDYVVIDTGQGDAEPEAAALAPFDVAIWFSGARSGGTAGPSPASDVALSSWLDGTGCLMLSSQDYHLDRGITTLMRNYLGAGAVSGDVGQVFVTSEGDVFGGLGSFGLSFPYPNGSDAILPDASARTAIRGFAGSAAVTRDAGYFRSTYWGLGLETLPTATRRAEAMAAFLDWCAPLPQLDGDGDGTANRVDCDPADPRAWSLPSPARDLVVGSSASAELSWSAPESPGTGMPSYDVLRSDRGADFSGAVCLSSSQTGTHAPDPAVPEADRVFYYLVRARNACGEHLGVDSDRVGRTGNSCS